MRMTEYTHSWIKRSEEDFLVADILLREDGPPNTICFHLQQAAEKLLKAFLSYKGKHVRKIHELDALVSECAKLESFFIELRDDAFYLTKFYTETRYPGDLPIFSKQDAEQAYKHADKIRSFVEKFLK